MALRRTMMWAPITAAIVIGANWPALSQEAPALQDCKQLDYQSSLALHPDAYQSVDFELAFDDYRGWIKKKIKSYVSLAKRGHARKSKRSSGLLTVHTRTGVSCTLRAKFRAHGDLDDHYPGNLDEEPSLNINLVDGHLFGITKLILFRPETRNGANEVFVATLMSQMGYQAPRTSMSTLRIAGSTRGAVDVIFQEKIVKEFLETNGLREGPIIEGDERFAFGKKYEHLRRGAALGRMSNAKWASKGPTSYQISHRAVQQMNRLFYRFDKSWATIHGSNMVDVVALRNLLDGPSSPLQFVNYPTFEALIFATGATHGFSQDDRRAVYDPFANSFTPIYYDGGANILSQQDDWLDRNITKSAQQAVSAATSEVGRLDRAALLEVLNKRDVRLTRAELDDVLTELLARLQQLAVTTRVEPVEIKNRDIYGVPDNKISYVFPGAQAGTFEICTDSLEDCRDIQSSPKLAEKLLAQTYVDDMGYPAIYFAFPRHELGSPFNQFSVSKAADIQRVTRQLDDFQLDLVGDVSAEVDPVLKSIKLIRTSKTGRAVLSNGTVAGWSITMTDVSGHVKNVQAGEQNFDQFGLTGCLTLSDLAVENLRISTDGASCEDAVNFVRVNGEVGRVRVVNSAFDAVDADFSRLKFSDLTIERAGNDCLDLSYGAYSGVEMALMNCGDKGVSVGETSAAIIDRLRVEGASIGLAAKDFGAIELRSGEVINTPSCVELYNKKQEFSGGYLKVIDKLTCAGASSKVGPTSMLETVGNS